jgi:hypothetical protein
MLPKKGTVFPGQSDGRKARLEYASLVAKAMRSELGGTHQAIKTVMRWTGAGERTVKNWLNAEKGPSGAYLIRLICESDSVLCAVLQAAGRGGVVGAIGRSTADNRRETTDFLQGASSSECDPFRSGEQGGMQNQENDSENVPDNVPKNVPDDVPDRDPAFDRGRDPNTLRPGPLLNERQRWFLAQLATTTNVKAADIIRRWGVVERTAKRDLFALKAQGLIEFVGSARTGSYRSVSE